MRERFANMSQAGKTVLAFIALFGLLAVCGGFGAGSDIPVSLEEAIDIARPEIDFEPVNAGARLVRQGFTNVPVWAVVFDIPGEGRDQYQEIMMVEVHGRTGEIIRTRSKTELGY